MNTETITRIVDLMRDGELISAIRIMRENTGLGLKDAKDYLTKGRPIHHTEDDQGQWLEELFGRLAADYLDAPAERVSQLSRSQLEDIVVDLVHCLRWDRLRDSVEGWDWEKLDDWSRENFDPKAPFWFSIKPLEAIIERAKLGEDFK